MSSSSSSSSSPIGGFGGPLIIDLTEGIDASTSPAMSRTAPLRSRPPRRAKKGAKVEASDVLGLSSDSSDGNAGDLTDTEEEYIPLGLSDGKASKGTTTTRQSRRLKKLRNVGGPCRKEEGKKPRARAKQEEELVTPARQHDEAGGGRGRGGDDDYDDDDQDAGRRKVPPPPPSAPPSSEAVRSYLRSRQSSVSKRIFDLSRIPPSESTPTGRTIKKMAAWSGHWPALREFLQNTIDHLGLLDHKTGRRHGALRLEVTAGGGTNDELATFRFLCGDEAVCSIAASRDELVIDQMYTYPIAPRALDTGVPDTTKSSASSSSTAGGFGDGFKTAAVALLALGRKDFRSLTWHFYARGQRIDWHFEGATRAAVGTFAKCEVLNVRIERRELPGSASSGVVSGDDASGADDDSGGRENFMRQVIRVRNIGKSFVEQAVPRLVVFWDLNYPSLVRSGRSGGDFLGPASEQPPIGGGVLGDKVRPEAGVYVKGIWVRKAKIAGTLMCFYGRRLEVNGRDRNDVDEEDLTTAVVFVFNQCDDPEYLRQLLAPLRGKSVAVAGASSGGSSSSSSGRSTRQTRGSGNDSGSWLLKSPRFLNHILEQYKDFILHDVMGVPRGAIYVSSKTTNSKDPFIKWASEFLKEAGSPLEPIEPGANRYLFQEASEAELTERCVEVLRQQERAHKGGQSEILSKAFRKVLTFMGLSRAKVVFSPHVKVAFVRGDRDIYAPEAPLTRELLVRVLNVCQSRLGGADGERFSALMQAAFEALPPGSTRNLTVEDVETAIKRAKDIQKENKNFLVDRRSNTGGSGSNSATENKSVPRAVTPDEIDLTVDNNGFGNETMEDITESRGGGRRLAPATSAVADLERQIARVSRVAEAGTERKRGGDNRDEHLPPIVPAADFGSDDAGTDTCLRPSSQLRTVNVDASLGGGFLLCDAGAAASIEYGRWSTATKAKVAAVRAALDESIDLVHRSIPSLGPLLGRVRHGYDSTNNTYEAFCDGTNIVVNLRTYVPKVPQPPPSSGAPPPQGLIHDLAVTVTHELAHFLEPREGHGPVWRDTHMSMVTQVMNHLSSSRNRAPSQGDSMRTASSAKRQKRG